MSVDNKTVDSMVEAFRIILTNHGTEPFVDRIDMLENLCAIYAPRLQNERYMVRNAVQAGAYRAILASSADARMEVAQHYAQIMESQYFMALWQVRKAVSWFLLALDPHAVPVEPQGVATTGMNKEEVDDWSTCLQAAKNGDPQAQFLVAKGYYMGHIGEEEDRNLEEALEWALKAAEQGYAEAQNWVGCRYQDAEVFGWRV